MVKLMLIIMLVFMAVMAMPPVTSGISTGEPVEVENWFTKLGTKKEKVTKFHFYFHDIDKVTSEVVANAKNTATSPTLFGMVKVCDDPVTVGPEFLSKQVGRLQGSYSYASTRDFNFICDLTLIFTNIKYSGSTISISGSNPPSLKHREMAVVGGTGVFRMASGVAVFSAYYFDVAKVKRDFKASAQAFKAEGNVSSDSLTIDAPGGFLFEWWSVFWDSFVARTNEKHSEVAVSYIETRLIKEREQQPQHQQLQMQQMLWQRNLLELWNMSENKKLTLSAHTGLVASLAASTVNGLVASATHDRFVKLWK
ncbi:hypothetical protein AgCh_014513 [Apium graveolens]